MTPKRSGLPKWDCHNQVDQEYFERWTNEQLDLIADRPPEAAEMHRVLQAMLSDRTLFRRMHARVRIDTAVGRKDVAAVERLTAEHPELRDFALQRSTYKRGRGRRKNERRPNDWSDDEVDALPWAVEDVIRIRAIWKQKQYFNKQNRTDPPTAIGIAARRHGLTEDRLEALLKNRGRRNRGII